METIPVVVERSRVVEGEEPEVGLARSLGPFLGGRDDIQHVDVGKLRASLLALHRQIGGLLGDLHRIGAFELREVQVAVEITAEGGVALIGTIKAGAKGAITLTFAPHPEPPVTSPAKP